MKVSNTVSKVITLEIRFLLQNSSPRMYKVVLKHGYIVF